MTEKEKFFIAAYCNSFNATQAAIEAGYSKKTAYSIGNENLKKPEIRNEIKIYVDSVISQYKDTLEYEIIQLYKLLAFYNPDDIITSEGDLKKKTLKEYGELAKCIKGIQVTYNAKGLKQKKILLQDRDCALEKLSQYMSLLKQNINVDITKYTDKDKEEFEQLKKKVIEEQKIE